MLSYRIFTFSPFSLSFPFFELLFSSRPGGGGGGVNKLYILMPEVSGGGRGDRAGHSGRRARRGAQALLLSGRRGITLRCSLISRP